MGFDQNTYQQTAHTKWMVSTVGPQAQTPYRNVDSLHQMFDPFLEINFSKIMLTGKSNKTMLYIQLNFASNVSDIHC